MKIGNGVKICIKCIKKKEGKTMKKFTKLLSLILALVLVVSVTGCVGTKVGQNDGRDEEGNLHISIGGTPIEKTDKNAKTYDLFQENKAAFEAANAGVIVDADPWNFDLKNYMTKAEGGDLPTLYSTSPTEISNIVDNGYTADITSLVKKYGYDKMLNNEKYGKLYMRDGKYYGLVKDGSLYDMGIAYNVDLFRQADLLDENGVPKFPQTWEELAETAKIIKDKTGKAGFAIASKSGQGGWHFMNIMWAFGADFMEQTKDGKWKATFASEEGVAALQYIKDLKWKYNVLQDELLADINVGGRMLATGDAAMIITQSAMLNSYAEKFGLKADNVAMSRMPAGPAGRFAQVGAEIYLFSGTEEQNEMCFKWLDMLGQGATVTDATKAQWAKNYAIKAEKGHVVGIRGANLWLNEERVKAEMDAMEPYRTVEDKFFADYVSGEGVEYMFEPERCVQQMYAALDNAIQTVLLDKNADCKTVLEQAQADFQANFLDKEI